MAKAKPPEGKSKTDIVREYVHSNPTATASQIVADLRRYGISLALAQKTRYLEGLKRRRQGQNRGEISATRAGGAASTKADAIREVAGGMPKPIRPRDVVIALAEKGIDVTRTQARQVLKKAGLLRRRRRDRKAAASVAASVGRSAAGTQLLSLESLLAAKKLADQLGSVVAAKQAMDALAKLS